ncbi:MAG TPA: glycoside hydrolase domain-containing protein [Streptosporangiaceae bacterium]|nr:glycoside hydrolase domain-containing protein [Streptosporangiaceae bacterium]
MIIDYSNFRPGIQELKGAGVTAVGRYIGWNSEPGYGNPGHNIDKAEADLLIGNGISVFLCFEYEAAAASKGAPQGTEDGKLASQQLANMGAPGDMAVYFAVDFDIPDYAPGSNDPKAKLGPVADYFAAINACKPRYKVGVYGGYYVVSRAMEAGLAQMGWQTVAWSGGMTCDKAVLLQTGAQVWAPNADINQLMHGAADFGQWPRPAPGQGPQRFEADGTVSLHDAAQKKGVGVCEVLWFTAQHRPNGYASIEEAYINAGQWETAMPAGMVYWA